jgi:hypothetical protein
MYQTGNNFGAQLNPMNKKNKSEGIFIIETYEDGRRYEGMSINGVKNGFGKLIYEDGAYYEGEFK